MKQTFSFETEFDEPRPPKQFRIQQRLSTQITDVALSYNTKLSAEDKATAAVDMARASYLDYTAVTCQPEAFIGNNYKLLFPQNIKICLVCTMYSEDEDLFVKSISNVQRNIKDLCDKYRLGPAGWKDVVVCIVADGRKPISPRVLELLTLMGCYSPALPRTSVDKQRVVGHLFQCTTSVCIEKKGERQFYVSSEVEVPMQTVFLLKENNKKKINSHKWFFSAFCEYLKPEVCLLLDVGTRPFPLAFWHLYHAFEKDPTIGGACGRRLGRLIDVGEMSVELGRFGRNLVNPLVAAQNFEYKMSNILDKSLESVLGFISVLPGAFSAYRYEALKGEPLEKYFKGEEKDPLEKPHAEKVDGLYEANLYLAEDRILCFEIFCKGYFLEYVKQARAETDAPDNLPELIGQRRRWLNGSNFAALNSVVNFKKVWNSSHTSNQKIISVFQFGYIVFNLLLNWFGLASFYLSFYFLFDVRNGDTSAGSAPVSVKGVDPFFPYGEQVFDVLQFIYIGSISAIFLASIGNKPKAYAGLYLALSIIFALIMAMMIFMAGWTIDLQVTTFIGNTTSSIGSKVTYVHINPSFRDLVISVLSTYFLYFVSSLMHLDVAHCFTSMLQYLFLMPTYAIIFMIYSFCNLHDVSWGTKAPPPVHDSAPAKINSQTGELEFETDAPIELSDINEEWRMTWMRFSSSEKVEEQKMVLKEEDKNQIVRTNVLLAWVFSNLLLVTFFTNNLTLQYFFPRHTGSVNPYLTFLLWSVTALSLIKAIGCTIYIFQTHKKRVGTFKYRPYSKVSKAV
ncbi:Chitin synthase, class 2 [Kappamyces sp. JEL0829]|nr:Chitin synthase, class 2 [Kappamyces sp. JEL0829]